MKKMPSREIQISVVVPIYNEEDNVGPLCEEIFTTLKKVDRSYEVVMVDDGSTDGSYLRIKKLQGKYSELRIVKLRDNRGQSAAFMAGFKHARGEFVITMDGDLQNDPGDIPELLKYTDSYDLIIGFRKNRKDTGWKRLQSKIANNIRRAVLKDNIIDVGCSLKLFRRSDLTAIPGFKGLHRFYPILLQAEGKTVKQVAVNHRPRFKGETKYGMMNRAFSSFKDMLAVKWMIKKKILP